MLQTTRARRIGAECTVIDRPSCWCGNSELLPFSPEYSRCAQCETLLRDRKPASELSRVAEDRTGFYGREYWFSHQETELGCPNILVRTRTDLPERCVHWLRTLLQYKLPPSRVLEIGSGPGGFVAMLRWAGFEAIGLELDRWVVQFVRDTFQVPLLLGPVEEQAIAPGSLDVIALMDVLEHLPDPASTMRHCLRLLQPDGMLLIQTPRYPEGRSHEEMIARRDRFLEMLKPADHLHLFSQQSLGELFRGMGAQHVVFEPAVFGEYDMFAVVSRVPPVRHDAAAIEASLGARPTGRMVQALLDLDADRTTLRQRYAEAEADRAARLEALEAHGGRLGEAEAERNRLHAEVTALHRHLEVAESDREARLQVIEKQGRQLGEVEAERNELRAELTALRRHVDIAEADRAARLEVIEQQGRRLGELEGQRNELLAATAAQREQIQLLSNERREVQELLDTIESTRAYRLLRRLGRWQLIARGPERAPTGSPGGLPITRTAEDLRFDAAYASIRDPKRNEWILYRPGAEDRIVERLRSLGFDVRPYEVDVADYRSYVAAAGYLEMFPDYYASLRAEKSLEHYLAAKLLALRSGDVYIDIASEHSPAPDIYRRVFGVTAYRQDLEYPPGLHADRIGSDAASLPVPDRFATKMALHCSFEHLEGESDIGFIREAGRVLRPGGAVCIVPLYLCEEYAIQTDPAVAVPAGVVFERDAVVYGARGWGNRHGRFYDPEHLAARVRANAVGLTITVYHIVNATEAHASCYVRFALLIEKPAAGPSANGELERVPVRSF